MATVLNFSLQDSNSPIMEQLTFFHDHAMITLVIITLFVGYLMTILLYNSFENRSFLSGQMIEMVWTILPAIVLLFIAFPSLRLLYLMDEINSPFCSIKVVGHQWYWSYELLNFQDVNFDSYMEKENHNNFRLIETDNNIILPKSLQIRTLVTAADVLHSWTIPSLGVKVDAVPGRLNQINFFSNRSGIFYGQCSEICGANHSFMPIKLESVSKTLFIKWMITV